MDQFTCGFGTSKSQVQTYAKCSREQVPPVGMMANKTSLALITIRIYYGMETRILAGSFQVDG